VYAAPLDLPETTFALHPEKPESKVTRIIKAPAPPRGAATVIELPLKLTDLAEPSPWTASRWPNPVPRLPRSTAMLTRLKARPLSLT
jgi:hypothetical protein